MILPGSRRVPPKCRTQENNKSREQRAEPLQTAALASAGPRKTAGSASSSLGVPFMLVLFDGVYSEAQTSTRRSCWERREDGASGASSVFTPLRPERDSRQAVVGRNYRAAALVHVHTSCVAGRPSRANETVGRQVGSDFALGFARLEPFLPVKLLPVLLRHPLDQRL